jgi:UDP-GlcNAc:undecaprenyl-phosphate/decaprenyl-phosphate GlcNAc-1-phosphate transferase
MAYLVVFLLCLFLSLVSTWRVRNFANARGWTDAPKTERHVHSIPVPRLGGVAIYFSFTVVVLAAMVSPRLLGISPILPEKPTLGLLGAATLIFILGLIDDMHPLSAYWKFGVQTVAAVCLYASGLEVQRVALIPHESVFHWMYSLPLTVFWVLLITNAFNLIDGLDGLAAGSALFSTFVLFILSLAMPNNLVAFFTVALAGATLGFLRFNFHPATIFLGDSGSLFIGFLLAALALAGSQKAPTIVAVTIPLISLGFPILDVTLAVARRFLSGKPLFGADKQHIHHKLLKRGLSQRDTVLILYAVTASFGFLSLLLLQSRRTVALVLALVGVGVLLGVQQLRYQEFAEMVSALQRFGRRRQILANHVAVRHAAERLLAACEMETICAILRDTLEPIGFDAISLETETREPLPIAPLYPLQPGPDGRLVFHWSALEVHAPAWELRLEMTTGSHHRLGYLSLIRSHSSEPLALDVNVLTDGFQSSLSEAIDRAFLQIKPSVDGGSSSASHTMAAVSTGD